MRIRFFVFLLLLFSGVAAFAQESGKGYAAPRGIRDMALIYQGGAQRIPWTREQLEPYVVHRFADGRKDWLFDGFLFLEFADMPECNFAPGYRGKRAARKDDWQRYLDSMFAPGKALHALDSCIAVNKAEIGDPGFRHKVVVTLPTPHPHQKDWGQANGRDLDFDNVDDAYAACKWYLDRLTDRFASAGFENIDLSGIYWVDEDMRFLGGFTRAISPYIHSLGLQFIWIPYFRAKGFEDWRGHGFDIVYHQPNHFFDPAIRDARLDEACSLARHYGMGMEFECDENALSQNVDCRADRMQAYIDAYWRNNVFTDAALAYYTGSHLLLDFVENPSKQNQAMADRLASVIVERRKFFR